MTRAERDRLIERYLREEMTPSEEQEFFVEAATDKELRFELKASRTVDSAFRKDRAAAPSGYSNVRANLAQSLAAGSQTAGTAASDVSASGTAAASSPGWMLATLITGIISLTALVLGIVAIDRTAKDGPSTIQPERTESVERKIDASVPSLGNDSPVQEREPQSAETEPSTPNSGARRSAEVPNRSSGPTPEPTRRTSEDPSPEPNTRNSTVSHSDVNESISDTVEKTQDWKIDLRNSELP